jgi:uncharacterized membrane protein YphA (DoxX/SURF4 family)
MEAVANIIPPTPPRASVALGMRLVIGGLLMFSGYLKINDLDSFIRALDAMQLPLLGSRPALMIQFAESLPWFELGLGGLLIGGVAARASALLAGLLFLAFTAVLASLKAQGLEIDCGCLGPLLAARIGWLHVGLDLLLAGACFALVYWKQFQPSLRTELPPTSSDANE